jgi:hypothetical protein
VRRIGVLSGAAVDDQDNKVRLAAFQQQLQQLGWTDTMCGLIIALPQAIPKTIANMQGNWSRWRQTSFWPPAVLWRQMLQATRPVPIVFAYSVARSVGVEVSPLNMRDAGEIERGVTAFARSTNGGLIVAASALATVQRNLIVEFAAQRPKKRPKRRRIRVSTTESTIEVTIGK